MGPAPRTDNPARSYYPESRTSVIPRKLPVLVPKAEPVDPFVRTAPDSPEYGVWTSGDYTGINLCRNSESQIRSLCEAFNHHLIADKPVVPKGSSLTVEKLEEKNIVGLYVDNNLSAADLEDANAYIKSMATDNFNAKDMFEARNDQIEACVVTALAWFLTKYDQIFKNKSSITTIPDGEEKPRRIFRPVPAL